MATASRCPPDYQTPGRDIAANLASFSGLTIFNGDGTDPEDAARLIDEAVGHVRGQRAPALLRLTVPRLEGHSFQDTQTYKSEDEIEAEWARDPLPKLRALRQSSDRRRAMGRARTCGRMAGRSGQE